MNKIFQLTPDTSGFILQSPNGDTDAYESVECLLICPAGQPIWLEACGRTEGISRHDTRSSCADGAHTMITLIGIRPSDAEKLCVQIDPPGRNNVQKQPLIDVLRTNDSFHVQTHAEALRCLAKIRARSGEPIQECGLNSPLVIGLKQMLKTRTTETAEHMERMEYMVSRLNEKLGIQPRESERLQLLAAMHDIGKLGIRTHIVNKPKALTEEEWSAMKAHSEIGYRIALSFQELADIAKEIRCHHEKWDGSGYPDGKKGDEIPLLSQILSVVDAYDVMTHDRAYKKAVSHVDAISELKKCSGSHFSPRVTRLFLEIFSTLCEDDIKKFH
jgi:HD-GYP domain-containing protein (c-di-GMP phosphodiesterase class II)